MLYRKGKRKKSSVNTFVDVYTSTVERENETVISPGNSNRNYDERVGGNLTLFEKKKEKAAMKNSYERGHNNNTII